MHSILGRNMRNKMEEFSSLMHTRLRAPPTPASALHAAMWSLRTLKAVTLVMRSLQATARKRGRALSVRSASGR